MNNLNCTLIEKYIEVNSKVKGHLAYLDDTRLVFLAKSPNNKDLWYLGFRNSENVDTKIALSSEALAMLVQLYRKQPNGEEVFPVQIITKWEVIIEEPTNKGA